MKEVSKTEEETIMKLHTIVNEQEVQEERTEIKA